MAPRAPLPRRAREIEPKAGVSRVINNSIDISINNNSIDIITINNSIDNSDDIWRNSINFAPSYSPGHRQKKGKQVVIDFVLK